MDLNLDLLQSTEEASMEPGMVVSNEPGFYKDGQFGIRIENLVFVKKWVGCLVSMYHILPCLALFQN